MNVFQSITISEINLSRNCVNFGRMQDFIWYKNVVQSTCTIKVLLLFQPVYFCVGFFRDTKGQGSQFIKFSLCVLGGLQSSSHKM